MVESFEEPEQSFELRRPNFPYSIGKVSVLIALSVDRSADASIGLRKIGN